MEDIGDNFDCSVVRSFKDDTLDPTTTDDHIKHNLRPLIRSKYKLTDFGMIDRPQSIHDNSMSTGTGRMKNRESFEEEEEEEENTRQSLNCFGGNIKTLEKENYTSLSRKRPQTMSTSSSFPLHRSLMWVQKGKLLSRWKERFIVITEEYIQCFKKGLAQLSQMGDFIFQLSLKEVKSVSLVDRRGYLTVVLELEGEAGLVVRKPEGLRDWYNTVQKMVKDAKARVMLSTEQFWNKGKGGGEVEGEEWLVGRRGAGGYLYNDRPSSVASVDRRHRQRQRHRQYQYSQDFPDQSSTLTKLSHKSKPRSKSVDRDRSRTSVTAAPRTVSVSEDSGNSSLNTYNTDTIQTNNSDWINVPRGYNMGWY